MQLSHAYHEVCKSAVDGHYEGAYFDDPDGSTLFEASSSVAIRRLRAMVQDLNINFAQTMRMQGHTYAIEGQEDEPGNDTDEDDSSRETIATTDQHSDFPIRMTRAEALDWVNRSLVRTRGRELVGTFNPLIIGELLRTQARRWRGLATAHVEQIANVCKRFLNDLLMDKCPKDVRNRLWPSQIATALSSRLRAAMGELDRLLEEERSHPINYNHYFTDTIQKMRRDRESKALKQAIASANAFLHADGSQVHAKVDPEVVVKNFSKRFESDMGRVSCEEVIDSVRAIYKVKQKTFIDNVTMQVIERHLIRGLHDIFSPTSIYKLKDEQIEALVSEPAIARRQRAALEDKMKKLKDGQRILKGVM